jgi:hypothetical protein
LERLVAIHSLWMKVERHRQTAVAFLRFQDQVDVYERESLHRQKKAASAAYVCQIGSL